MMSSAKQLRNIERVEDPHHGPYQPDSRHRHAGTDSPCEGTGRTGTVSVPPTTPPVCGHLERQRGVAEPLCAAQETRRSRPAHHLDKISRLKQELKDIDKQKVVQRRTKCWYVALVGYTNVGKSTLMTLLSKSDVFAENRHFATLDTTVRVTIETCHSC